MFVTVTGLLALAQMLFLPRLLSAPEFGMLALALSLTQAVQQFGDMGFGNAAARVHLDGTSRAVFREYGVSINAVVSLGAIGVIALLIAVVDLDPKTAGTLALAILTGSLLATSKMRASSRIQSGDERRASFENSIWQNAPKPGMLLGSLGGLAIFASLGSVVTALLLGRPFPPRRPPTLRAIASTSRYWAPGLILVLAAFATAWLDTYVLTAFDGVASAGQYQAIVRPLIGVTYLYFPILGLIQSAANRNDVDRVRRLNFVSLALSSLAAASVAVVLVFLGEQIWPDYSFPVDVVVVAAIAIVAACASAVFGTELLVQGKQLHSAAATLGGAAILCIVTLVLVPSLGLLGAAVGSAAGWSVSSGAQYCVSRANRIKRNRNPAGSQGEFQ